MSEFPISEPPTAEAPNRFEQNPTSFAELESRPDLYTSNLQYEGDQTIPLTESIVELAVDELDGRHYDMLAAMELGGAEPAVGVWVARNAAGQPGYRQDYVMLAPMNGKSLSELKASNSLIAVYEKKIDPETYHETVAEPYAVGRKGLGLERLGLSDTGISREHLQVSVAHGSLVFKDTSTNGTKLVAGVKAPEARVN